MKEVKIQLIQSLIINSVKNETYHRGQVVKAADEKNNTVAYHSQAGDEAHHEAMLARGMFTQAERLKTWFGEYLTGTGLLADDPLISSSEMGGTIDICLKVSDRFNDGYTKTIARLSQKYVEDRMLHLWYASTDKEMSEFYATIAEDDLTGIRRCFAKTPPKAPEYAFPTAISIHYPIPRTASGQQVGIITPDNSAVADEMQLFNYPVCVARGEDTEISYTLTGEDGKKPIDDIVVRCDSPCCAPMMVGGSWCVKGITEGITIVTLFSRHNDKVYAKFAVQVTP